MPNATKATPSPSKKSASVAPEAINAIEMLKADHDQVKAMFKKYGGLGDRAMAARRSSLQEFAWN